MFRVFIILLSSGALGINTLKSQANLSNPVAKQVLFGQYNPANYSPSAAVKDKDSIMAIINNSVSADSLKSHLIKLESFQTRHTASDTVSLTRGIGAARRWIHKKFQEFSSNNENRLQVSYLDFTSNICGVTKHRNVLGILPGLDTSRKDIVLVEAHMDSRCAGRCDTTCYAPGMDDNGSGTALVIELTRIMSGLSFDRTIVFTTVTGEEQGLNGGDAMARYLKDNDVPFLACLNNDVVGGVECGVNASPPSCSPAGSIDSISLRVFSFSPGNDTNLISIHKQLARYVKMQQIEEVNPLTGFQTELKLQIREDRVGRGGDHIPFRQQQFRAVRFTSSHEHGNGAGMSPDRQHTSTDVLGFDKSIPPDGILDTFLIDFNYLERNTLTNAINLTLLAKSPPVPSPVYDYFNFGNIEAIRFENDDTLYSHRIGVRSKASNDLYFDTIYTFQEHYIPVSLINPKGNVQFHVMNLEGEIESIPTTHVSEEFLSVAEEIEEIACVSIFPNPASRIFQLKWKCAVKPETIDIQIVDDRGGLVFQERIASFDASGMHQIELSNASSGVYKLIYIINQREQFTESFILK